MQVAQRIRRDPRRPERHYDADAGVEHPLRKCCNDARFNLNVDDASASALLAIVSSDTSTVERMPAIVKLQLPARYGQNDCVMVLGRKGWLFSDTVKGAVASANLYSLVETAKANGVEPHAYLTRLFTRLPHAKTVENFEALLPWNVKASLP
jgi:hypothetical protein